MTKNEMMVKIAACITTLYESNGCPESTLYIAMCNMDIDDWHTLRSIMVKAGFITVGRDCWVTLTTLGAETAAKLEQVITKS